MKTRTAAINQIKAMLVGAPDAVREKYRGKTTFALINSLARCRPDTQNDPISVVVLAACKTPAERVQFLEAQDQALTTRLNGLVSQASPALRAAHGVGPDTAAQLIVTAGTNPHRLRSEAAFATLCGAAPVPASSGKTNRHRLSRGGDRGANNALHRIALVHMSNHKQTRDYVQRQLANGRSKKEILRLLKRAVAYRTGRDQRRAATLRYDFQRWRASPVRPKNTSNRRGNPDGVWPGTGFDRSS